MVAATAWAAAIGCRRDAARASFGAPARASLGGALGRRSGAARPRCCASPLGRAACTPCGVDAGELVRGGRAVAMIRSLLEHVENACHGAGCTPTAHPQAAACPPRAPRDGHSSGVVGAHLGCCSGLPPMPLQRRSLHPSVVVIATRALFRSRSDTSSAPFTRAARAPLVHHSNVGAARIRERMLVWQYFAAELGHIGEFVSFEGAL